MINVNALSRLPLRNKEAENVNISLLHFHDLPLTAVEVGEYTLKGNTLSKVTKY